MSPSPRDISAAEAPPAIDRAESTVANKIWMRFMISDFNGDMPYYSISARAVRYFGNSSGFLYGLPRLASYFFLGILPRTALSSESSCDSPHSVSSCVRSRRCGNGAFHRCAFHAAIPLRLQPRLQSDGRPKSPRPSITPAMSANRSVMSEMSEGVFSSPLKTTGLALSSS